MSSGLAQRSINPALLGSLELVSDKIHPLPGATGRRLESEYDKRLSGLTGTPTGDNVTYYEHIATLRDKASRGFFVAFRETMDAFLARFAVCGCTSPAFDARGQCQNCLKWDPTRFPEWLMKSPEKQAERFIHIYAVRCHPSQVAVMRSHEDWLTPIADDQTFDTLAYFLEKQGIVKEQIHKR
jgi:hypothetical protein